MVPHRYHFAALLSLLGLGLGLQRATGVQADDKVFFGKHDITSVFFIEKSENRNQVHYGIRLDAHCRPQGKAPMYAYWREREQGPDIYLPLKSIEQPAYGIHHQDVEISFSGGGRLQVWLEALRERRLTVETYRQGRRCVARALTQIAGKKRVQLDRVYAQIALLGVEYIRLIGRTLDGVPVKERIDP